MKLIKYAFLLTSMVFLISCSDDEKLKDFATKSDVLENENSVEQLKLEAKETYELVVEQSKSITNLQNEVERLVESLELIEKDREFLTALRTYDFSQMKNNKNDLEDLKLSIELKKKNDRIADLKKKAKKNKTKLKVAVSQINPWGDSLVAVVHIPNAGFKTVSARESVGNGWEVLNIEKNKVSFRHVSGKVKSVKL